MSEFIERVAVQLTVKIGEQICLTEQEAWMSEKVILTDNPQWRLKVLSNRQRVSRRLQILNQEIMGLSAILREHKSYEQKISMGV